MYFGHIWYAFYLGVFMLIEDTNHLGVLVFPQTPEHTEGFEDQKFEEKKCL